MSRHPNPSTRLRSTEAVPYFTWRQFLQAVWYFVRDHRLAYVSLLVILGLTYLYNFVPAYLIGKVVDFLTTHQTAPDFGPVLSYAALLGISWIIVSLIRLESKNRLGNLYNEVVYEAKVQGFQRLIDFSLAWHQKENTGNKIQRIQTGVSQLRQFYYELSRELLNNAIDMVGVVLLFARLGWIFFLFTFGYIVIFAVNEFYFQRRIQAANDAYNRALERSTGTYFEGATNLMTVKSLGIRRKVTDKVSQAELAAKDHSNAIRRLGTYKWQSFQTISGLAYAGFALLIAQQYFGGWLTAGAMLVYYTYFVRLTRAAGDAGDIVVNLIEQKSGVSRMLPIYQDEIVDFFGKDRWPADWQTITITDGQFHYTDERNHFAIKNLNLTIHRGELVGIVGASGSGKSTLAKLLLGLYRLTAGTFSVGGKDYYAIAHDDLTKHVSTVLQETELFNLSLRENLSLFKQVAPKQLARALKIAQLEPVVAKLPEGLETLIGEKGYKLSGGERQRVGIARAICSNAEILVFDEATSALDSKTEQAIQRALEQELADQTMIVIAHRLSTLRQVDRILVFDKGQIVEEGTFNQLLKQKNSRFAELYHLQQKVGQL